MPANRNPVLMFLGVALVFAGLSPLAEAQQSTDAESAESSAAAAAALSEEEVNPEEEDDPEQEEIYDEIVVTGGLIEDSLQDTPESVAVWNADALTDAGADQLQDVFNLTANAYQIANGEGFGIRGINQTSVGTGGIGELGSYYVDGVALTGLAKRIGPTQLWDVEQVEILRGPQTTNVGRNALAGAIVLATNEPEFRDASRWRFGIADENTYEIAGLVNTTINDTSALRFTAELWNTDGFVTNEFRDEDDFDARQFLTLRAKYLYLPSSNANVSLLVSGQYGETERGTDVVDLERGGDRINNSNLDTSVNNDTLALSAELRAGLSDRWALRSISSILESDTLQFFDTTNDAGGGSAFSLRDSVDDNWAQDLRFEYADDSNRGVLGVFYTDVLIAGETTGENVLLVRELGVPEALLPFYPTTTRIGLDSPFDIATTNFALFGHWDWQFADQWRVFAGLRYDREELDVDEAITTIPLDADALPNPGFFPPELAGIIEAVNAALLAQAGTSVNDTETDYDALLPEIGISYQWNDDLTTSLFYKRGYRAGGAAVNLIGRLDEFDPEFLDLIEFSVRSIGLDNRLTLNANVYAGSWTDQQVSVQQSASQFDFLTENAGESEIYGFELDMTYRPQAAWDVYGSVGFAHTEFTDFVTVEQGDLTGNRFQLAPEWTAALGVNYRFGDGWFVHADVAYQGEAFASVENDPRFIADERTLFNLRGGFERATYSILAYLSNATDETYLVTSFEGGPSGRLGTYGDPRQGGVQIILRF